MWIYSTKEGRIFYSSRYENGIPSVHLPVGEVNLLRSAHKNDPPGCVEPGAGALQGPDGRAHSSTHLK